MPKLLQRSAVVDAPAPLVLAVIADTHSQPHPRAVELVAAHAPVAILHAGDIGDPSVVATFAEIAPVLAIRGNIDARGLPDVLVIDAGGLRVYLVHVGVAGPHLRADVARAARAEEAALVVCGHSHVPFVGRERGLGVFNPGSIGPRRFHLPIVFGTIAIAGDGKVTFGHVDCETGAAWTPP
jgi:putative phosphoesterase